MKTRKFGIYWTAARLASVESMSSVQMANTVANTTVTVLLNIEKIRREYLAGTIEDKNIDGE
jgi:hypothetical protein